MEIPNNFALFIVCLLIAEVILNVAIIFKVNYTEIDWIAYMQEVKGVIDGDFNYTNLKGDTGPLVYPGGFVAIYTILYYITNEGKNIFLAQFIFAAIYLLTTCLVFFIYKDSKKVPAYVLVLLCISKRVHSIHSLRLFNDTIAMMFLYLSIFLFSKNRWSIGCFIFSVAVSVKMNVLLFAPGLGILLVKKFGLLDTIKKLMICALVQIAVGVPFMMKDVWAYLKGSFDFGRVFMYKWTVNWKFLDEETFLDKRFALLLLILHLTFLVIFIFSRWIRDEGLFRVLTNQPKKTNLISQRVDTAHIVELMFQSNFIGIVFSRSLHYQFYSWYFHTLPYLFWVHTPLPIWIRPILMLAIEYCWNVYPATPFSSALLFTCHLLILFSMLIMKRNPTQIEKEKVKKIS